MDPGDTFVIQYDIAAIKTAEINTVLIYHPALNAQIDVGYREFSSSLVHLWRHLTHIEVANLNDM